VAACSGGGEGAPAPWTPPGRLSETGLYADPARHAIAPDVLPFSPQYPLWSDGAAKRRWIRLPEGASVDASDPDAWRFPVGTRLWKEFSFDRRVETRLIARTPAGWVFAAYRWVEDESDAFLVPEDGAPAVHPIAPGVRHDIPSRADCLACHGGRTTPVLGFSALQLSPDRDPLAPHAERPPAGSADLRTLVDRGLVRGLPSDLDVDRLRIADPTARGRAARGWLHANCGSCHASGGALRGLDLSLEARVRDASVPPAAIATTVDRPSRFRPRALAHADPVRVEPGRPEASVLFARLASREPATQMPPLGTRLVDAEARALVEAWIREDLAPAEARPLPGPRRPTSYQPPKE
jgi:hypothetical protein